MNKNVLLFGGELFNKGAQAMTFVASDEIRKRLPDYEVVLVSTSDYSRDEKEKEQYRFSIKPYPRYRELLLVAISKKIKILSTFLSKKSQLMETFINADYVLDISGYALGSDWGCNSSINYCLRIIFAKMCGKRIFLMPQSFGPFCYQGKKADITQRMIRKCLRYPELIMAREKKGYDQLVTNFGLKNVVKSYDMVLANKGINLDNIYKNKPVLDHLEIYEKAVGIIPNMKTFKYCSENTLFTIYDTVVELLKTHHKNVYFLFHSTDDRDLCLSLYDRYNKRYECVYCVDKELNCIEFDRCIGSFEFLIASRYHSIVHAYRNSVPAIVLGWANKYQELMEIFGQEEYQFNVREEIDLSLVRSAVIKMIAECDEEKGKINSGLKNVQKENVFDYIHLFPQ